MHSMQLAGSQATTSGCPVELLTCQLPFLLLLTTCSPQAGVCAVDTPHDPEAACQATLAAVQHGTHKTSHCLPCCGGPAVDMRSSGGTTAAVIPHQWVQAAAQEQRHTHTYICCKNMGRPPALPSAWHLWKRAAWQSNMVPWASPLHSNIGVQPPARCVTTPCAGSLGSSQGRGHTVVHTGHPLPHVQALQGMLKRQ